MVFWGFETKARLGIKSKSPPTPSKARVNDFGQIHRGRSKKYLAAGESHVNNRHMLGVPCR
jgi:hypothetical protein